MTLFKMIMNTVISTKGARCMMIDLKDFYLNTPMNRPEYMRLKLSDIPEEIIVQYKLRDIATLDGFVYTEITKRMYGLPQAGIITQVLLEDRLGKHGYSQSKIIPGLWTHNTRPILFSLVVDDFAVKYTRKEDAEHLLNVLKKDYIATEDWEGQKYLRLTIEWNYKNGQVHLWMRDTLAKLCCDSNIKHQTRFRTHHISTTSQHMEPRSNMPSNWMNPQNWTKQASNMYNKLQERSYIMDERLTLPSFRRSVR